MTIRKWAGLIPTKCDICGKKLRRYFIDGATPYGWAIMCETCHMEYGYGLGLGKGQKYSCKDGKKVEG